MEQDKKTLRKERREQRKQNIGRARRFRTARTWGILALIVAAAGIAGWVWWFRLSAGPAEFSATESCVNHQTLAMHEHPRLSIIINGEFGGFSLKIVFFLFFFFFVSLVLV